jgi:hypothetical protein
MGLANFSRLQQVFFIERLITQKNDSRLRNCATLGTIISDDSRGFGHLPKSSPAFWVVVTAVLSIICCGGTLLLGLLAYPASGHIPDLGLKVRAIEERRNSPFQPDKETG